MQRRVLVQIAVVFALALVARGLHFHAMRDSLLYEVLLADAGAYDRWAQQLAAGDWIGSQVFYQTPLYPYLLGGLYAAVGHDVWIARFAQALCGALASVFLSRAGAGFFSERVGWCAGILLALYPPAIFFDGILQKASLDLLLMTALLWLAAAAQQQPTRWKMFGAGLLLGAMILNRENAAALIPVLLAWALWLSRSRGAAQALAASLALALGMAALLVPVGLRNAHVGGAFLLTTAQMGPNFYIGNHRGADGTYTPMRAGRGDADFERDDARLLAQDDLDRALTPAEVSDYWMSRTFADIRSAPGAWTRLLAWKWFLTWNRVEFVDAEAIHTHQRESKPLAALGWVLSFGVVFPLAIAGVWWTRHAWRRLWLLYAMALTFAAAVTLFYVFARYRYPLAPIALLFAGAGVHELWLQMQRPRSHARELAIGLGLGACAAVFSNWPVPQRYADDAVTYYNAASRLLEQNRVPDAIALFERAISADPLFPETYNNLGRAELERGDIEKARRTLDRGVKLAPEHALLHFNLAVATSRQGDEPATKALLERAIALDPLLVGAYGPLAELEFRHGESAAAIQHLRRAVELEPESAIAHADLGLGLLLQGSLPEAIAALRNAVRIDPGLLPARNRLAWTLATAADPQLRNGAEARAMAEEMCRATGHQQPELLQTLAAAQAASGDFDAAAASAAMAIRLAREADAIALADRIESQRRVYLDGRALHDAAVTSERR